MHIHLCTNNRAPRWKFTDHCKTELRQGAREESGTPAWLAVMSKVLVLCNQHYQFELTFNIEYFDYLCIYI